jgi:predicted nucleic acid-binding protein
VLYAYLDASGLAKRYIPERGSTTVDYLFTRIPSDRLFVLEVGLAEVVSVFVRKRNAGSITPAEYAQAFAGFGNEVAYPPIPRKLMVNALTAFAFIETYSLNATDALLLRSALDLAAPLKAAGHDLVVVASDQRLLTAAGAEGLLTFNPETQSAADLDAMIGP